MQTRRGKPSTATESPLRGRFKKAEETQGMGTVERPAGPNGEVPSPLRSFCAFRQMICPFFLLQGRVWRQECFLGEEGGPALGGGAVGERPRRGGAKRRATRQTPRQGGKSRRSSSLKGGIAAKSGQGVRDLVHQHERVDRGKATLQSSAVTQA